MKKEYFTTRMRPCEAGPWNEIDGLLTGLLNNTEIEVEKSGRDRIVG